MKALFNETILTSFEDPVVNFEILDDLLNLNNSLIDSIDKETKLSEVLEQLDRVTESISTNGLNESSLSIIKVFQPELLDSIIPSKLTDDSAEIAIEGLVSITIKVKDAIIAFLKSMKDKFLKIIKKIKEWWIASDKLISDYKKRLLEVKAFDKNKLKNKIPYFKEAVLPDVNKKVFIFITDGLVRIDEYVTMLNSKIGLVSAMSKTEVDRISTELEDMIKILTKMFLPKDKVVAGMELIDPKNSPILSTNYIQIGEISGTSTQDIKLRFFYLNENSKCLKALTKIEWIKTTDKLIKLTKENDNTEVNKFINLSKQLIRLWSKIITGWIKILTTYKKVEIKALIELYGCREI